MIALQFADHVRKVAHPKHRVPSFFHISTRPTPILSEKKRQSVTSPIEVILWIQRQQDTVALYFIIKVVNESRKERHATNTFE
jgi:hypothetical protein